MEYTEDYPSKPPKARISCKCFTKSGEDRHREKFGPWRSVNSLPTSSTPTSIPRARSALVYSMRQVHNQLNIVLFIITLNMMIWMDTRYRRRDGGRPSLSSRYYSASRCNLVPHLFLHIDVTSIRGLCTPYCIRVGPRLKSFLTICSNQEIAPARPVSSELPPS